MEIHSHIKCIRLICRVSHIIKQTVDTIVKPPPFFSKETPKWLLKSFKKPKPRIIN